MHNNIMAAGSRDRPPMLATGRCANWQSRFMRYIDTKPNGEALKKCILDGPYKFSNIIILGQPATDESPEVPERTTLETFSNLSPENKAHYEEEKEAIHLILTRIGMTFTQLLMLARQLMICGFTSRDEESIESYYSRFYKMMNEMVRNQMEVATMQIAKPITHPSESASEEDSDPDQVQRDKYMQKNLALIAKYFKRLYKPTNNNFRTSSNFRNKNVDTTLRYVNENQTGQFGNLRTLTIDGAKETIGSHVVQQI
ncbi:hypothetical protein Tco_1458858 [Tanacetum coccineum]